MTQSTPTQDLVAKDLHGHEWRFKHIFRGKSHPSCHFASCLFDDIRSTSKTFAYDTLEYFCDFQKISCRGCFCFPELNHEERDRVLRAMDGCSYKAAAGGSLSNSLVALARLGARHIGGPPLNVAMAGSVGSDPLGGFYRAKLRRANVNFLSPPVKNGTTGTVIVLTTPDAQRTMLAY